MALDEAVLLLTGSTGGPYYYDTVLTVYTFDGATFTEVGCNDDYSGDPNDPYASAVALSLTAGTTYYFQISTADGGAFSPANLVFNIAED